MRALKRIISAIVLIAIGTILVLPIEAKISNGTITIKWLKKNYYSKKQSNKRYYTKAQTKKSYWTKGQTENNFYRKSYINNLISNYYTQPQVDSLLGNYLTLLSASSTYLPLSGGTLAGGLTGTSITGTTITSTSFAYSLAKTKFLTIPANNFIPRTGTTLTYVEAGNAYYYGGAGSAYPMAGIDLPNGAIVTRLSLYTRDASSSNVSLSLERRSLLVDGGDSLATVASDGTVATPSFLASTTSISNGTIDNNNYYYYMWADMTNSSSTLYLRAAKITYSLTNLDN